MKRRRIRRFYRDFASALGTGWLLVIVLAVLTGGWIGRWGALILPVQVLSSLAFACLCSNRRRRRRTLQHHDSTEGLRYLPV
jgi:uncharacterized iron-regulated membrane protein